MDIIEFINGHVIWFIYTFLACLLAGFCTRIGLRLLAKTKSQFTNEGLFYLVLGLSIPGIMVHELGHIIMCKLGRADIEHYALIEILQDKDDHFAGFGGHVKHEPHSNVVVKLGIFLGPAILSGLLMVILCICYFYYPTWDLYKFGMLYLLISLCIGCTPSLQDFSNLLHYFHKNVRDGALTIMIIVTSFCAFYALTEFIGILLALLITFIPAMTGLIYLAKQQHAKEKREKKEKEAREKKERARKKQDEAVEKKLKLLDELVNDVADA